MTGDATKVRRFYSLRLAAWIAALGLFNLGPGLVYAQTAKPPPAKAAAPWKFRLEEARIEDIHRAIRSRQITCAGLVQAYINRIRAYDGPCVAPVNPSDVSDPQNHFPSVPLQLRSFIFSVLRNRCYGKHFFEAA